MRAQRLRRDVSNSEHSSSSYHSSDDDDLQPPPQDSFDWKRSFDIANDIGRQQTCDADTMIKAFLSKVTKMPSEIDELFTDRLHAVLPLSPKYVVDLVNVCATLLFFQDCH